ncbi:MAG: hypothetical protein WAU60_04590, partial [Candidatus Competibacter denitrificans]
YRIVKHRHGGWYYGLKMKKKGATMVSSYLICDACGRFGPPAGFLNQNGLRLCYQCWFEEWQERQAPTQKSAIDFDKPPAIKPDDGNDPANE